MSVEPIWLLRDFVIAVHERLIAEYGGSPGLRDEGLLESALARPMHRFAYGNPSLVEMAAHPTRWESPKITRSWPPLSPPPFFSKGTGCA